MNGEEEEEGKERGAPENTDRYHNLWVGRVGYVINTGTAVLV